MSRGLLRVEWVVTARRDANFSCGFGLFHIASPAASPIKAIPSIKELYLDPAQAS